MRKTKYKDVTKKTLGKWVVSKRVKLMKIQAYSFLNRFDLFLEKRGIYVIRSHNKELVVTIKDESFFNLYNIYYKYLYAPKSYYVWYVILREKTNTKSKRSKKRSANRGVGARSIYIKNRDGNECVMCGNDEHLTIDHIEPISKSGDNSIYNLCTLCSECNEEKSNKTLKDFVYKYVLPKQLLKEEISKYETT